MKIVAIDLELNQPSNRIIQIGAAVACTEAGKVLNSQTWWVDPGEMINIDYPLRGSSSSQQTLGNLLGEDFIVTHTFCKEPASCQLESFWKWLLENGSGGKLIQWGSADLHLLLKESKNLNITYPSRLRMLDLKVAYQFLFSKNNKGLGLSKALKLQGLEFQGRAHDGRADAINTALLYLTMADKISKITKIERILSE